MKRSIACFAGVLLAVALTPAALAAVATPALSPLQVEWQPTGDYAGMTLRVSGPLGVVEQGFAAGENPLFDLGSMETVADGLYTWEIVAAPRLDEGVRRAMAEARAAGDGAVEGRLRASGALPNAGDMVQSGSFRVVGGVIQQPTGEAERSPGLRRVTSDATGGNVRRVTAEDQVIPDDLIVQGSICAGLDCVNNENFGFDTIRMKENNTRIDFTDTSSTAGFASQDWEIAANDSASGGRNALIVSDENTQLFVVESGNLANALYVDDQARVGLRTSNPVLDLHISTGNTPGIRLEQTNASGFTAQTWDIAGNEANFFVRDVTGGSLLPFRIRPGAPTSSIDIAASGNVGIGTGAPDADADVTVASGETSAILMQKAGAVRFRLENTTAATEWDITNDGNGDLAITRVGSGGSDLEIEQDGDMGNCGNPDHDFVISVGPGCAATPRSFIDAGDTGFSTSSSRTYKTNIQSLTVEGILDRIAQTPVYEYDFVDGPTDRIGLVAEEFHRIFGRGSEKELSGHEIQLALWLAVQELTRRTDEVQEKDREIDDLQARLAALESAVAGIATAPAQQQVP